MKIECVVISMHANKLSESPAFLEGLAVRMKHPAMFSLQMVTVLIKLKLN